MNAAKIGFTERLQAKQQGPASLASSSFRGAQLHPVTSRTQRHFPVRKLGSLVKAIAAEPAMERPDSTGRFGRFGGKYVPETLISALAELEQAYAEAMNDPKFTVSCLSGCYPHLCPAN